VRQSSGAFGAGDSRDLIRGHSRNSRIPRFLHSAFFLLHLRRLDYIGGVKWLRWILLVLGLAAFFALGIGVGIIAPRLAGLRLSEEKKYLNTDTVVQQVQTLSQLVTVKYVMEKVVVLDDVKWSEWLGTSRVLMVAHGVVKAGVDVSRITARDVQVSGRKIVISLPPAQITDAYLDDKETQVIERSTGLLRSFDKDLEQTARQQALDDIERAARHNGILQDAKDKAESQLANLFHQLGYETVEFREGLLPGVVGGG
jgi:hypothetical protein